MTIVKEYWESFLTTKDNKLQTLHFTKFLFEVPFIARFQWNCTTGVKNSRDLKTIPSFSFSFARSFHGLYCSQVAISLSDVKHLPFSARPISLLFTFTGIYYSRSIQRVLGKLLMSMAFQTPLKVKISFKEYSRSS